MGESRSSSDGKQTLRRNLNMAENIFIYLIWTIDVSTDEEIVVGEEESSLCDIQYLEPILLWEVWDI